jgi:hypothetical protein
MGKSKTIKKIERTDWERVQALVRHLRLLDDYCKWGIDELDYDYLGEIAAKIRLLVWEGRNNRPLLLDLMRRFENEITWAPDQWNDKQLTQFMGEMAYWLELPSGEAQWVSNLELIRTWAEQHGAAHEDPAIDEHFVYALESVIVVQGCTQLMGLLNGIANNVLCVARQFLEQLSEVRPDLFEPAESQPRSGAPHLVRTV